MFRLWSAVFWSTSFQVHGFRIQGCRLRVLAYIGSMHLLRFRGSALQHWVYKHRSLIQGLCFALSLSLFPCLTLASMFTFRSTVFRSLSKLLHSFHVPSLTFLQFLQLMASILCEMEHLIAQHWHIIWGRQQRQQNLEGRRRSVREWDGEGTLDLEIPETQTLDPKPCGQRY